MTRLDLNLKLTTVLLRATNEIERVIKKDINNYKLNASEFGVLEFLYHKNEQPIQIICSKLLMPNSSMTYVIDGLEKKNFVARKPSKEDKRYTNIALTEEGKSYFSTIFPKHENMLNTLYETLSEDEISQLINLSKKIGIEAKNK